MSRMKITQITIILNRGPNLPEKREYMRSLTNDAKFKAAVADRIAAMESMYHTTASHDAAKDQYTIDATDHFRERGE